MQNMKITLWPKTIIGKWASPVEYFFYSFDNVKNYLGYAYADIYDCRIWFGWFIAALFLL